MYILDDYVDGKIYAGYDIYDFKGGLPKRFRDIMESVTAEEFPESSEGLEHFDEDGYDFYFGTMEDDKLFKYMCDRNCGNFITGV